MADLKASVQGYDAVVALRFIAANVDNSQLSDADFRKVVGDSLSSLVCKSGDYATEEEELYGDDLPPEDDKSKKRVRWKDIKPLRR